MGCEHLDEHYELYLLGAVADGACLDICEHVDRECAYCLDHLREAAHSIYLLTLTTRPARLNPKLKSQLMKRLRKK
jgi:hypothetical protein